MNPGKTLAVGLLGLILIALGFETTISVHFAPLYAIGNNPAWGFGPRELAHCVGFAGCTLAGWALIRSFGTQRGRRLNLIAALAGLCLFPLFLRWPDWMPLALDRGFRKFACTILIPFYLIGTVMMLQYVKDCPALARSIPAAFMSAGAMWFWSISWEVGVQPFESVYGGPPRGYIQWAQLICDFVGIWAPATIFVAARYRARGNPRAELLLTAAQQ